MDRVFSPKRLQREGKIEEALEYYKRRYYESLDERDSFLSSLYLDEVAQTLMKSNEQVARVSLSFDHLHAALTEVAIRGDLDQEAREQAKLDIRITLRKRFPEKFGGSESEEDDQAN